MGMMAIGKDEKIADYLLRIVLSMVSNFTIGVIGAFVSFFFGLFSLLYAYKTSIFTGTAFFSLAMLAALSFLATWLIGFYCATAGVVYVGAKLIGPNMRIEDNSQRRHNRFIHRNYTE